MRVAVAIAFEQTTTPDIADVAQTAIDVCEALTFCGHNAFIARIDRRAFYDQDRIRSEILSWKIDAVFNLFEGYVEDQFAEARFAACLEMLGIPFTGNCSAALSAARDKHNVYQVLRLCGIDVPDDMVFEPRAFDEKQPLQNISFPPPYFIKPRYEDGSVGIDADSYAGSLDDLAEKLSLKMNRLNMPLIVESFIDGPEYSCGFICPDVEGCLGVSMIDYARVSSMQPFLTYGAKWDQTDPLYDVVPKTVQGLKKREITNIIDLAVMSAKAIGCTGYFRVDIREKDGRFFVIDINPNPDISRSSGFVRQAAGKGYIYTRLVNRILEGALCLQKK